MIACGHYEIRIFDVATGKEQGAVGHRTKVLAASLSPDQKTVVTAGADMTIRLATGSETRRFNEKNTRQMNGVAISADGKLALSKGVLAVWETATGKACANLPPLGSEVRPVAFSPDGKTLVVSRYGQPTEENLVLIDAATWKIKGHLAGHQGASNALVFSADGRYLISASDDGSAVVWDMTKVARPR